MTETGHPNSSDVQPFRSVQQRSIWLGGAPVQGEKQTDSSLAAQAANPPACAASAQFCRDYRLANMRGHGHLRLAAECRLGRGKRDAKASPSVHHGRSAQVQCGGAIPLKPAKPYVFHGSPAAKLQATGMSCDSGSIRSRPGHTRAKSGHPGGAEPCSPCGIPQDSLRRCLSRFLAPDRVSIHVYVRRFL